MMIKYGACTLHAGQLMLETLSEYIIFIAFRRQRASMLHLCVHCLSCKIILYVCNGYRWMSRSRTSAES